MKRIKIFLLISTLLLLLAIQKNKAQDSTDVVVPVDEVVSDAFSSGLLIEHATTNTTAEGRMEFVIHHRFMDNISEAYNLYGIFGASNVRLGLNRGITDKLQIGFGAEKANHIYELGAKYRIVEQTQKMPLSIAINANAAICGKKKAEFGDGYKFSNRMSYFAELILASKIHSRISLTANVGYGHLNKVDSTFQNDALTFGGGTKIHIYNAFSAICEYSLAYYTKAREWQQPKPLHNLAAGFEIATSTHTFQFFATTYDRIIPQYNTIETNHDFQDGKMVFGFNISVRF